jgi:glycerol kinase
LESVNILYYSFLFLSPSHHDRHTGKAYHNALVWNDTRTHDICEKLIEQGGKDRFRDITGLPISPYFSATKLKYLLDLIPDLKQDALNGDALFGTIDSFLIWKLTGGRVHVTDVTNASRTLLMSLKALQWDSNQLEIFDIPKQMLPTIVPSSGVVGTVASAHSDLSLGGTDALSGIPIAGILGDQQAALFGQTCFEPGEAKCTYGTGCFLLKNTGNTIIPSSKLPSPPFPIRSSSSSHCHYRPWPPYHCGLSIEVIPPSGVCSGRVGGI